MLKYKLIQLKACEEAIEWVGNMDIQEAWQKCHRGDWMLWLAARVMDDKRKFTLANAECAALALPYMKDQRSINAVDIARKYGIGEATKEQLVKAYYTAGDAYAKAYYTAGDAYVKAADDAYTYAAYAAYAAAANAPDFAADAANYAAAAVAANYAAAAVAANYAAAAVAANYASRVDYARKKALKQAADIARGIITVEDLNL